MKGHRVAYAALLALGLSLPAAGEQAYVKITEPAPGARLTAAGPSRLVYEVEPGPRGDHVHIYADDKEVGILRQLKGSYTLPPLAAGAHSLCVKVVNRAHVPIGVEQCVDVIRE